MPQLPLFPDEAAPAEDSDTTECHPMQIVGYPASHSIGTFEWGRAGARGHGLAVAQSPAVAPQVGRAAQARHPVTTLFYPGSGRSSPAAHEAIVLQNDGCIRVVRAV